MLKNLRRQLERGDDELREPKGENNTRVVYSTSATAPLKERHYQLQNGGFYTLIVIYVLQNSI